MRHRIARAILCLALPAVAIAAAAEEPLVPDAPTAPELQVAGGYTLDPGFNDGAFFLDRFAGPDSANYRGRKLVRLPNGDVVVVGLVPAYNQPDPPDGQFHIGLVRYNATGQRVAWSFASSYGNFGNQYLIYPGSNLSGQLTPRFTAVKDVKAIGDRIYIMVDHTPDGGSRDVQLLIFSDASGETGRFLGHFTLFTSPFNEDGAEMALFSSGTIGGAPYKLLAAATVYGGSGNYVRLSRFNVGGTTTFEGDSAFGTNGTSIAFLFQNSGGCSTAVATAGACPLIARSLAVGFRGFTGSGPIYVGAERQYSTTSATSNDWDAAVVKFSSSGDLDTSFGGSTGAGSGNGFAFVQFDRGTKEDRNRGIAVRTLGLGIPASPYRDEVYVVASVAQACASGTGVGKLDQDGNYVATFGDNGKLRFGGWDDPSDAQACAVYGPASPLAVARDGATLAIAGQDDAEVQADFIPSAAVAFVDADSGAVAQRFASAIRPPSGTFPSSSALYGIVANGDGSFSVAGDARDSSTGNTLMYATARVGRDVIFRDGFD
ncbi:hypothetical protein [Dokdonella sp.]|uniref:hypothetical protein n=1 Tax=Dokdonella sp. TaxID=2291710 RepID=UPI001B1E7655|nr:hypothetical protein [Dokdonella sp.]MBO9662062.1 hypothetical protein [Dokdonella sp.]